LYIAIDGYGMNKYILLFGPLVTLAMSISFIINNDPLWAAFFLFVLFGFQIIYIVDCIRKKRRDAVLWVLGLFFLFTLVHLVYWFTFLKKEQ